MQTKDSPRGWQVHGDYPASAIAGTLPRHSVHYLAGPAGKERTALTVDIAVAAASSVATCGMSTERASLAGFMRQPAGSSIGVAIITPKPCADPMRRAIEANTMARGVRSPVPVAVTGDWRSEASGRMLSELEAFFVKQHGVQIGLIIVDMPLPHGELMSLARADRAVLAVQDEAPVAMQNGGVVLALGDGPRLTALNPVRGEPWSRAFSLELVTIGGDECLVVRPGEELLPPVRKPQAAQAPALVAAQEPELPITSRVVLIVSRGEIAPEVRSKWEAMGFEVVQRESAALPRVGQIVLGRREIVVSGEDQRPEELRARVTRMKEEAMRLGVAGDVLIRAA